jgi:tRNA modification GTPase
MTNRNLAILMTAPGSGAISVVRLIGKGVTAFVQAYFSGNPRASGCVHGLLRDSEGRVIDDPVVTQSSEDQAELNLHGSPWIVHEVLGLARRAGFEVMDSLTLPLPLEATDRWASSISSDPGRGAEIEEDVLTHLPLARTELAVRGLLAQPAAWEQWQGLSAAERREQAKRMLDDRALWWLLHPPRIAIVGAANVGKSTLANQLFAQERSIVADLPGTTRDWVGELANINGLVVMLVDTPGQRLTDDPIEKEAIDRSGSVIESADLILLILDASVDRQSSSALLGRKRSIPTLYVANKQDQRTWEAGEINAVPLTATTGEGLNEIRRAIARQFGCDSFETGRARFWTEGQRAFIQSEASNMQR